MWQPRRRTRRMIVPMIETAIDPRQPRRLERKANIVCLLSPAKTGVVSLFFALVIFGLGATLPAAEPEALSAEWKLISNTDGVALYRRQRPASNESRAIGEITAPPTRVSLRPAASSRLPAVHARSQPAGAGGSGFLNTLPQHG